MRTCIDRDTLQSIAAENCSAMSEKGLICMHCFQPVVLVLPPGGVTRTQMPCAFFKHTVPNALCPCMIRRASSTKSACVKKVPPKSGNAPWIRACGRLFEDNAVSPHRIVLRDTHSTPPSPVNPHQENTTEIFDATTVPVYRYTGFKLDNAQLFFCLDEFADSVQSLTTVLFHCADNLLRETCCMTPVLVNCDGRHMLVRFLINVSLESAHIGLSELFGKHYIPPACFQAQPLLDVRNPLQVLSTQGRLFMDKVHRDALLVFPTEKLRVYNCIPGSGKTTALKAAVKAWPGKKILILVYNKSNQVALQHELRGHAGCVVKTLDALCALVMPRKNTCPEEEMLEQSDSEPEQTCVELSSETAVDAVSENESNCEDQQQEENEEENENPCDNEEDEFFDPVFSDATFLATHFPEWNFLDKLCRGGGGGSASMVQNRLLHPRSVPRICKFHQRLTLSSMSDASAPWTGCVESSPIQQIVGTRSTFASRKYLCDKDLLLVAEFAKFDAVLIDEFQDCCSMLEQRLLRQATCPIILVGDHRQTINEFRHQINTTFCSKNDKCVFPVEPARLEQLPTVEFYNTYRLCPLTTAFLEDLTGMKAVSTRSDFATIHWQTAIIAPDTLVLCRTNENVVKVALQYQAQGIRVMNGARIAAQLKNAKTTGTLRGMSTVAMHLTAKGTLSSTIKMLIDREISMEELARGGVLAVSTVHGLKGFETAHVAVHKDVFEHAHAEEQSKSKDNAERNVFLVALSRHKTSLVILMDVPIPDIPEPGAKVQKTIDFVRI